MAHKMVFHRVQVIRRRIGSNWFGGALEPLEKGHETCLLPRRVMKGVCFALILNKFWGNLTHENVCTKLLNEPCPTTHTSPIGALRRLLDAVGHRLLALVTEESDPVK